MLSTEQRQERLEELLQRIQRNRVKLGPSVDEAASVEAVAPPAEPSIGKAAPPTSASAEPEMTIELSPDDIEPEVGDEPLELDLSDEAQPSEEPVIELTADDQVADLDIDKTAKQPKPAAAPSGPTPMPAIDENAAADQTLVDDEPEMDDDEPEIEVSYGTEEALALQAELGLGESGIPTTDAAEGTDQLTLDGLQRDQGEAEPQEDMEFDNLPAPAPPDARLDEVLEPSMLATSDSSDLIAEPLPKTPAPSMELPETPKPDEIAQKSPEPRTRLRAKTQEDLSGPIVELNLEDEYKADDIPTPKPAEVSTAKETPKPAIETPKPAIETPKPAAKTAERPAMDVGDALADALSTQPEGKPTEVDAITPDAETREVDAPQPTTSEEATAASAEAGPQKYAVERPIDKQAPVAAISGAVPAPRAATFGELIQSALKVGHKDS